MTNHKLKKIELKRISDKIYKTTLQYNSGKLTELQNRTSYDSGSQELTINLDSLPNSQSYKVSHDVDFAPYTSKYDTLKTKFREVSTQTMIEEFQSIEFNINDTNYPPPSKAASVTPLTLSSFRSYNNITNQKRAESTYSAFSNSFIITDLTLEINSVNQTFDIYIKLINTDTGKHYKPIDSNSISFQPDLFRGSLISPIVLRVEEVAQGSAKNLEFTLPNISTNILKQGFAVIISDKSLDSLADWKLIDSKKVYFDHN